MATITVIPSAPNEQAVDSFLVPHCKGKVEFHNGGDQDQEDLLEELSEEQIASLLEEAATRLRQRATTSGAPEVDTLLIQPDSKRFISFHLLFPVVFCSVMGINYSLSFPKLDPGTLPKSYIETSGSICRITSITTGSNHISINDPVTVVRTKQSDTERATAGKQWFDMPLTSTNSQTLRDIQLIQMREVLDPHRHYKKNILNRVPKYSQVCRIFVFNWHPLSGPVNTCTSFPLWHMYLTISLSHLPKKQNLLLTFNVQVGTIVADHSEFYSARLTNRERKGTILEEIMTDTRTIARFKQKRKELQEKSRAGGKEYYKKVKERRRRRK